MAHEINNPLAFILSNLNSLHSYVEEVKQVIAAYRASPESGQALEERIGFQQTLEDIDVLLGETSEGGQRVRTIVQELKTFSRADENTVFEPVEVADIAASTLLLTERELASRARVVKDLLLLAPVSSAPRGKLHQVVMNLLVNAMQALGDKDPRDNEYPRAHRGPTARSRCSTSRTPAVASPRRRKGASSSRSSPPSRWGLAPASGSACVKPWCRSWAGRSPSVSTRGQGTTFEVRVPIEAAPAV